MEDARKPFGRYVLRISDDERHSILGYCAPEQNLCIPIATSFVVRLSTSNVGLTSVNSMIFVFAREAAYFTSWMNSRAFRPRGDGAEVPGASAIRTASMSKPKKVLS